MMSAMRTTRPLLGCVLLAAGLFMSPAQSEAETVFKPIPTQYIAALGDPVRPPGSERNRGAYGAWIRVLAAFG